MVKETTVTSRIKSVLKDEAVNKILFDTRFDNLSHFLTTTLERYISDEELFLNQTPSNDTSLETIQDLITTTITEAKEEILTAIYALPRLFMKQSASDLETNIVEQIINDLDIEQIIECSTATEFAKKFKFDYQRDYVFAVIKQLQDEEKLSYRNNRIIWRVKKLD